MNSRPRPYLDIAPRPWCAPDLAGASGETHHPGAAEDPAAYVLAQARSQADGLLDAARAEIQLVRDEAHRQGMAAAQQALAAERERAAAQLTTSLEELRAERETFLRQAQPEILKLSLAVAEKVIGREVSESPDIVLDLIRKSMKRLKDKAQLHIRVNPEDLELVREARADLLASVDGVEKIEVSDDRRVGRGGCVIESPNGTLDARIATQLRELERSITKAASRESDGTE